MSKILLVIKREYLVRVKKKSFIIMTLLAPLLMAGLILIPAWIMSREDKQEKRIAVVGDGAGLFRGTLKSTASVKFEFPSIAKPARLKQTFREQGYFGILWIDPKVAVVPSAVQLFSNKQPSMELISYISNAMEKEIERKKLESYNIKNLDRILQEVRSAVKIQTILITDEGQEKKTSTGLAMGIAYASGLLIYMLTFMFGAQVMRGVIEEKTNRIVEVLISSVKPFQLMMGKIIGIALVGLTQFFLWIILTVAIIGYAKSAFMPDLQKEVNNPVVQNIMTSTSGQEEAVKAVTPELNDFQVVLDSLSSINWFLILGSFIFFFLGGYLLYAALFASIGSAVDNETDTQQFMLPLTLPLLLGLFVSMGAFQNPDSPLVFWFSFIPFTSPMVMMARLPFGVPPLELIISMAVLVLTFIGTTWLAAKIYRTGILMYGKKPTYKEMFKWLRYKNY